ncbi:hypothetical protein GGI05_003791, partial [Coemansia sp. RSA 2603]
APSPCCPAIHVAAAISSWHILGPVPCCWILFPLAKMVALTISWRSSTAWLLFGQMLLTAAMQGCVGSCGRGSRLCGCWRRWLRSRTCRIRLRRRARLTCCS